MNLARAARRGAQTLIEYALLVMLIAAICIALLFTLGPTIAGNFSSVNSAIANAPGAPGGGSGGGGEPNPAEFIVLTPDPQSGSPVQFDGPDTASSWDWDFGDGSAHGTTEDPTHTYAAPDFYTVVLTTNEGTYSEVIEVTAPALPPLSGALDFVDGSGWSFIPAFGETLKLHGIFVDGSSADDPSAGPMYNDYVAAGLTCSWTAQPTDGTSSTDNTYTTTGPAFSIGGGPGSSLTFDGTGMTPGVYHEIVMDCSAPGAGTATVTVYRLAYVYP